MLLLFDARIRKQQARSRWKIIRFPAVMLSQATGIFCWQRYAAYQGMSPRHTALIATMYDTQTTDGILRAVEQYLGTLRED